MEKADKYCLHCCMPADEENECEYCSQGVPVPDQNHPLFLKPGVVLAGHYLVGRILGFGGFGITYLGVDLNLELRVAIKEHLPRDIACRGTDSLHVAPLSENEAEDFNYGLERFIDEARTLARFTGHPNIVPVLNFFEANNTAYLVMPYLDGRSLRDRMKSEAIPLFESEAIQIACMILQGLKSVHAKGMLHRDIKPDNVFITTEGRASLIDFGSARTAIGRLTGDVSKIVSEGYSPFEQYMVSAKEGPYTDIYSVGATIYYMLTGRRPEPSTERDKSGARDIKIDISKAGASYALAQVVAKSMEYQPDNRYQTVEQMIDGLEACAKNQDPLPPTRRVPGKADFNAVENDDVKAPSRFGRLPGLKTVFAALVLLCLAAVAIMSLVNDSNKNPCGDMTSSECAEKAAELYSIGDYEGALTLIYSAPYIYSGLRGFYYMAAGASPEWGSPERFNCSKEKECDIYSFWLADKTGAIKAQGMGALEIRCNKGIADACHRLGIIHYESDRNLKAAEKTLKRAYTLGDLGGMGTYGLFLRETEIDVPEGMRLLHEACSKGNMAACEDYGCGLRKGKDWDAGIPFLEKSCTHGHMQGCYWLGIAEEVGHKDWPAAKHWFRKACNGGNMFGCYRYAHGLKDFENKWEEAKPWYQKACDGGAMSGCNGYAWILDKKEGNWEQAKKLYKLSCDAGLPNGCHNYAFGLEKWDNDWQGAIPWYEKACNQNNATACWNYAIGIESNGGDLVTALPWYHKACDQGFEKACKKVGS